MSIIGNPIIVGKKPEQTKTVSPTTSQQVVTPDSGKVLSSVTVNAAPLQSKTVTPNKAGFTVSPDSGKYGLSSVKVNGNSNLVAGNIKSGVTIFGVTGTYNPVTSAIVISGLESTDTITCSGGGKSYSATWDTTDNRWEIVGLPLGTFTVTATNGAKTTTETVLIDIAGVYEIEFYLGICLYINGDECEIRTGGWQKAYEINGYNGTAQKNDSSMTVRGANDDSLIECGFATINEIDTTGFKTLKVNVINTINPYDGTCGTIRLKNGDSGSSVTMVGSTVKEYAIDLANYQGKYNIVLYGYIYTSGFEFNKIWLE